MVTIGKDQVNQSSYAKLLGMTFEESQKWKEDIYGKGGLIASLNQRLFHIGWQPCLKVSTTNLKKTIPH